MSFGQEMKDFAAGFSTGFSLVEGAKERKWRSRENDITRSGLTSEEYDRFNKDREKFGEGAGGGGVKQPRGTEGGVSSAPKDKKAAGKERYDYLISLGVPANLASGMVGNAFAESSFNSSLQGGGDKGTAHGEFQWRNERFDGLKRFAAENKLDPSDWHTQYQYAWHETQQLPSFKKMLAAADPTQAADLFALHFERPAGAQTGDPNNIHNIKGRRQYAQDFSYDLPEGSIGTSQVASGDYSPGGSGSAVAPKKAIAEAPDAAPAAAPAPAADKQADAGFAQAEPTDVALYTGSELNPLDDQLEEQFPVYAAEGGTIPDPNYGAPRKFTQAVGSDTGGPASAIPLPRQIDFAAANKPIGDQPSTGAQQRFRDMLAARAAKNAAAESAATTQPGVPVFNGDPNAYIRAQQANLAQQRQRFQRANYHPPDRDSQHFPRPQPQFQAQPFMSYQEWSSQQPGYAEWYKQNYPQGSALPTTTALRPRFAAGGQVRKEDDPAVRKNPISGIVAARDYRGLAPGAGPVREESSALWRIEASLGQRNAQKAAQQRLAQRDTAYHKRTTTKTTKTERPSTGKGEPYLDETEHPKGGKKPKEDLSLHKAATGVTVPSPSTVPEMTGPELAAARAVPKPPVQPMVSDPMGAVVPGTEPKYEPYDSSGRPGISELPAVDAMGNPTGGAAAEPDYARPEPVPEQQGPPASARPAVALDPNRNPALDNTTLPPEQQGPPVPPPPPAAPHVASAIPAEAATPAPQPPLIRRTDQPPIPPTPGHVASAIPSGPATPAEQPAQIRRTDQPPASAASTMDTSPEPWIPQNVPEAAQGTLAQAWGAGRAMVNANNPDERAERESFFMAKLVDAMKAGAPHSVISAYADNFGVRAPPRPKQALGFAAGGAVPEPDDEEETPANLQAAAADQPVIPPGGANLRAATPEVEAKAKGGQGLVRPEEIKESTKAGLKYINDVILSPTPQAAVGADPAQRSAQQNFDTGDHALTAQEVQELGAKVDPDNKLGQAEKILKIQQDTYDWYMANGHPEKAAAAAASVLMYGRRVSQVSGNMALAALESGRPDAMQQAAMFMKKAYENMPDGKELKVDPGKGGSMHYQIVDIDTGEVEQEGDASAEDMKTMAQRMANGSEWARQTMQVASDTGIETQTGVSGGRGRHGGKSATAQNQQEREDARQALNEAGRAYLADPSEENKQKYYEMEDAATNVGVAPSMINLNRKRFQVDPPPEKETGTATEKEDRKADADLAGKLGELDKQIQTEKDPAKKAQLEYQKTTTTMDDGYNRAAKRAKWQKSTTGVENVTADMDEEQGKVVTGLAREFVAANNVDGQDAGFIMKAAIDPAVPLTMDGNKVRVGDQGSYFFNNNMFTRIMTLRRAAKKAAAG